MDLDIKEILNYSWFVFMGLWGGSVSYLERLAKNGKHSYLRLFVEWITSAFTAIITAYGCDYFEFSFATTAGLAGVAGHMGGRALFIIEKVIHVKIDKYCDTRDKDE